VLKKIITIFLMFNLMVVPSHAQNSTTYFPTKKICTKNKLDTINKQKLICLKHKKQYKWHKIQTNTNSIEIKNDVITETQIQKIYNKIIDGFKPYNDTEIILDLVISPKSNLKNVNIYIDQYKKSLYPYSKLLGKKTVLVFFSESEIDWWKSKIMEIEKTNNYPLWSCQFKVTELCAYGSTKAGFALLYHMIGSQHQVDQDYKYLIDHEAVHIYQGNNWNNRHALCWGNEGYANIIGIAHSSKNLNVSHVRTNQIQQIHQIFPNYKNFNQSEWELNLRYLLNNFNQCIHSKSGYSIGMLIFEYMFLSYNFDQVQSFVYDTANNNYTFINALQKNFNISEDIFYYNLSKYLTEETK